MPRKDGKPDTRYIVSQDDVGSEDEINDKISHNKQPAPNIVHNKDKYAVDGIVEHNVIDYQTLYR